MGSPCKVSRLEGSTLVTSVTAPSSAETRRIVPVPKPPIRITPSRLQVDEPIGADDSPKVCGGLVPETSTFINVLPCWNAMKRLSGDHHGEPAPSVRGNARASTESKARTHRRF